MMHLSPDVSPFVGWLLASVWIFHGLYSKLCRGVPRHRQIVARVLGEGLAGPATTLIGVLECALGGWILLGWQPVLCAVVQTAALVAMNTLELRYARDLLLGPAGMLALNACFISLGWWWAISLP